MLCVTIVNYHVIHNEEEIGLARQGCKARGSAFALLIYFV